MQRKIRHWCCKAGFPQKCTLAAKATQSSMMSKLPELSRGFRGDPGSGNGCHRSDIDNEQKGSRKASRLLKTKSQQALIMAWRQENDGWNRAERTTKHKNWVETSLGERSRPGNHPYVAHDSCLTIENAKGKRMKPCFMVLKTSFFRLF